MSVLVTGGKGFLGAEVIRQLVARSGDVVCLDLKTSPGRLGPLAERITMVGGGLGKVDQLEELLGEHGVDRVAHLVYAPPSDGPDAVYSQAHAMVTGVVDLMEAARRAGVERFVFPSSIHYYGAQEAHGQVWLDEKAPSLAETQYGVGKHFCELVARAYSASGALSAVSVRIPAVYGPGAAVGARSVNVAAVNAARGEVASLPYRAGQGVFVGHVEDVARGIVEVLFASSPRHGAYNSGGHSVTYQDIADVVAELVPGADVRFDAEAPPSDLPYLIDGSRIASEFGIVHRSLLEGMRTVVEAARGDTGR
jgi:UDP-glucose 4-epimerase